MIGETSIIIEHVAGSRLVPSLEARKWDRICDQYVSDAVQAIVSDTIQGCSDARAIVQARSRLDMAYGDEGMHPHLTGYYRALAQRPSFAKVIADARPYRHLFPLPWPDDFDRHH